MRFIKENSYINKNESVSIGNKMLYDLCKSFPMDDNVNGLIAKLWLIGRSYAASIERRNYGKKYSKVNAEGKKLNLNTGSNGTDSFFEKVSKTIINDDDYRNIVNAINKLNNKKFKFNFKDDETILQETCEIVIRFNLLIRNAIENVDENALEEFEKYNNKQKEERNLSYFISFSSKFLHFHLPNVIFIIDSFSFSHAKKKNDTKRKSNYIFKDKDGNILFEIIQDNVYLLNIKYNTENEENYIHHVERCYAIICKLHEKYKCDITPRMVDNFLMMINTKSNIENIK